MLRVYVAHPYADFFFADAFLDCNCACHEYKRKNRWRKANLLACCLRLEYWQKVDSTSRHFVEKRTAVGIDIELERLCDRLPRRPADESLTVVRQSGAASRSCAVRTL